VLDPGGPRILPVTQQVQHGPQQSREDEFEQAIREGVADMATYYGTFIFRDRRLEGPRYRQTSNVSELVDGPQQPYPKTPHGADIPLDRYRRSI
jgi:hypothetical protein